ncbi:MAG TPA: GDSL-type esterase/lipase family protein [Bryobacteraceae bacterium]|nr:GDSL-type esterase/lipase family protein [Bryobacteraceae bacterium]
MAAVLWILVLSTLLHQSRYPSLWGRYSREWMIVIGAALILATAVTLAQFRRKKARRGGDWRYMVAAVVLSALVSMAALEASMRMFNLLGSSFYSEIRRYSQVMRPDPVLYYGNPRSFRGVFQHVEVSTNQLGLRERPLVAKSPDRTRVLVLGDSVAFGWGVPAGLVASRELERRLQQRTGAAVETINSGVPGYNTLQEQLFLKTYGDALQPDLVLLLYVDNDTDYLDTSKPFVPGMPNPIERPLAAADYVLSSSRVLFMARHLAPVVLSFLMPPAADESRTPGWRSSMQSLSGIAAFCQSRRIPFVTFLYRLTADPHTDRLRIALSGAAQHEQFYFSDTLPWFANRNFRRLVNSFVDSHPNAAGHQILGDGMAEFLLSHPGLLSPARKAR